MVGGGGVCGYRSGRGGGSPDGGGMVVVVVGSNLELYV